MGIKGKELQTLVDAIRHFSDADVCLDFVVSLRWPDGTVKCPTCGSDKVTLMASRRVWQCKTQHPKRQFSVKVGTIFEDSPIGLDKWFAAIWMVANCPGDVTPRELARELEVTHKTAGYMIRRIQLAINTGSFERSAGADYFESDAGVIRLREFAHGANRPVHNR